MEHKWNQDIIIVGAGASGLMAAITAARNGKKVLVIEHKDKAGKKILATGNGKCNYTNQYQGDECYRTDHKDIVMDVIGKFNFDNTIEFFKELGILPKERGGYYYPHSEQASSILQVLMMECDRLGVHFHYNEKVVEISQWKQKNNLSEKVTRNSSKYQGSQGKLQIVTESAVDKDMKTYEVYECIISTGGCASPNLGSDGSGFVLAQKLGHTVIKPLPALVQLKASDKFCKTISGVRTGGKVTVYKMDKQTKEKTILIEESGELIFTDYGISGIPILQISRFVAKALDCHHQIQLKLDFLPEFTMEALETYLKQRVTQNSHKNLEEMMVGLLNQKLNYIVIKEAKLDPFSPCHKIKELEISSLAEQIKKFTLTITGTHSFDHAQVSMGGIPLYEVNSETLESTLVKGVYFCGEILNVDGTCGGYNLQWAWSSGYVAGRAASL